MDAVGVKDEGRVRDVMLSSSLGEAQAFLKYSPVKQRIDLCIRI